MGVEVEIFLRARLPGRALERMTILVKADENGAAIGRQGQVAGGRVARPHVDADVHRRRTRMEQSRLHLDEVADRLDRAGGAASSGDVSSRMRRSR